MVKASYPSMSIQEIIAALAMWGLSIADEQLQRPSPEFVEGIFCACLQQATDITVESLTGPVQEAVEACTSQNGPQETYRTCTQPL
ncbi:hypothetical protein K435DRAFT_370468 [Dendrothele bispora CBS 962.96]|uniref:Kinetochore protein Nuf2 N-terminal domain-containing protein n=1 Tax=Dendrothele bispora (strain CBS 962.96) TaxID=1314807 RepID=A0A4S8LBQ0_DENBC|nr:hypothetical protein K435DRAFT_370468 [Dendrothele bispora CBS 962.96]